MKFSQKFAAIASVGLATALCGGAAMARGNDDIRWSVTVGSNAGVPVYRHAPPVYVQQPVYVQPAPVYRDHYYHQPRSYHYQQPTRWDRDGDGIPNRRDRVYNPRWDRDGDGVPNWRERGHRR